MPYNRILPRMVDARTKQVYAGMRTALRRLILVYLKVAVSDDVESGGFDVISEAPILIEAGTGRTYTFRVVQVPARIRWEGANTDDASAPGGIIKEGAVTCYVSVEDSPWIAATQGDAQSYLVVDGHRLKVVAGPQPEGMGAILEHSYALDQYTQDGLMDSVDGGVRGALG